MYLSQTFFKLTAFATTIFVITILAMVAMLLGDPEAPVNTWFNRNGAVVLTVEVIAIGVTGALAMILDRQETIRELQNKQAKTPGTTATTPPRTPDVGS